MTGDNNSMHADAGGAFLIAEMMDHGLSDDEVRAEMGGFMPATIEEEIARARRRFEGEASRVRAHAKTAERQPPANVLTDGAALLDQVYAFLGRFVAYPSEHAPVAHTLWIAHTHAMDAFESTPRLAFLSPEPGSGKTRALEVTEPLVPRPVEAVNVTPAYLFRKVADESGRPTILFDEIDTVFGPKAKDNEEIRGLLNAGHRKGAVAGRCVVKGQTVTTEDIPAYCAVALAGLGGLPDTILSRSVTIRMRRRAPDEKVEPWRRRIHAPEAEGLRDQLAMWAVECVGPCHRYLARNAAGVNDRDADEALLAIADVAGKNWPARARAAAVAFVTEGKDSSPSLGVRLLSDFRSVFAEADKAWAKLHALDDAPWGDLRGKPLSALKAAPSLRHKTQAHAAAPSHDRYGQAAEKQGM